MKRYAAITLALICTLATSVSAQPAPPARPNTAAPPAAAAPPAPAFRPLAPLVINPCIAIRPDGRESLPGYNFAAVHDGRLALLVQRSNDNETTATDFKPVEPFANSSFYMHVVNARFGERATALFIAATVRDDGIILIERYSVEGDRPPEFTHYRLRCNP